QNPTYGQLVFSNNCRYGCQGINKIPTKESMKGTTIFRDGRHVADQTLAAMEEMEHYCAAHPGSPAALRRPGLSIRGRTFVALLGPTIEEGIAGFGDSVQAALRAFD